MKAGYRIDPVNLYVTRVHIYGSMLIYLSPRISEYDLTLLQITKNCNFVQNTSLKYVNIYKY
jgi:hypothetical protein